MSGCVVHYTTGLRIPSAYSTSRNSNDWWPGSESKEPTLSCVERRAVFEKMCARLRAGCRFGLLELLVSQLPRTRLLPQNVLVRVWSEPQRVSLVQVQRWAVGSRIYCRVTRQALPGYPASTPSGSSGSLGAPLARACVGTGEVRDHGEWWFDGCRYCYCSDGREFCSVLSCPALAARCRNIQTHLNGCCPTCAGDGTLSKCLFENDSSRRCRLAGPQWPGVPLARLGTQLRRGRKLAAGQVRRLHVPRWPCAVQQQDVPTGALCPAKNFDRRVLFLLWLLVDWHDVTNI